MVHEQSKAARRRYSDGAFHCRFFVGEGIDVGAGPDGLAQYAGIFPLMRSVRPWDLVDGDAQSMEGVDEGSFDFLHSSHCLEHMIDPLAALRRWAEIVRPGGYLVITVPDEDMYEQGHWPSRFNDDHKWSFTVYKKKSWSPKSVNLLDLAKEMGDLLSLERLEVIGDFFRPELKAKGFDQTLTPVAECAIETVWRRI